MKRMLKESILSRCSSTRLHNTLLMDLDLMGWALWKRWLEQKTLFNFQTIRRNALFTTERNVRLESTWIKFRWSAIVCHGLLELIQTNMRWKPSLLKVSYFAGVHLLWSREGELCWKSNLERQKLFDSMYWSLCRCCCWPKCDERRYVIEFGSCIHRNSGLNSLTQELSSWVYDERRKRILAQLFPTPAEEELGGVKTVTESYHKYKREYVKHLRFNPEEENLSRCISD